MFKHQIKPEPEPEEPPVEEPTCEEELARLEGIIDAIEAQLADKDALIASLQGLNESMVNTIVGMQEEIDAQGQTIAALQAQVAAGTDLT